MEEELITVLDGLGYRAGLQHLPQGTPLPYVVLHEISAFDDITLDGRSGWIEGRVQVDCYAESVSEVTAMKRAITVELSGYRGEKIWTMRLEGRGGRPEGDGVEVISRARLDFAVTYRE